MNLSIISYYKELYEKSYKEGVMAHEMNNLAVVKARFNDASTYLKKLAQLDLANKAEYEKRAERLKGIADKIEVVPYKSNQSVQAVNNQTYTQQVDTSQKETEDMSSFFTFFEPHELSSGFEGVIGLDEAKEAVTEYVINPIRYPEAYNYKFISSKCILLEGPPGTGKTTFAKAVAKEIQQPFALVNVAGLVNCYVGETGKTIDKVFNYLRDYVSKNGVGITVFFDEFDEIAKSRSGDDKASQSAVPALLRNLDGVKENKNFLILANTNCKDSLDSGILSRFRRKIYIPLPDQTMRLKFFKDKLKQLEPEHYEKIDFERVAICAEGLSGRTITHICDDFLHFIGGVKAGIRKCTDYNEFLVQKITDSK